MGWMIGFEFAGFWPLERDFLANSILRIERSRCRGIEVVAAVGVQAASSSLAGALGMNRPVQSDQR
jgi:hypothetical protein